MQDTVVALKSFIEKHFNRPDVFAKKTFPPVHRAFPSHPATLAGKLADFLQKNRRTATFAVLLEDFRVAKNMSAPELYAAAQVNRQLYHKIMANRHYHPEKNTAIKFGLALNLDETDFFTLMESAGYTFSSSSKFDLVVLFCLREKLYNLIEVNTLLDSIGEKILD